MTESNPYDPPGSSLFLADSAGRGEPRRRFARLLWFASLAVCPLGLVAVSFIYPHIDSYPPPWPPRTPPHRWAEGLVWGQVGVSLVAFATVAWPFRSGLARPLAWLGIILLLGGTALFGLGVIMDKTGMYL